MQSLFRKTFLLSGIVVFFTAVPAFVFGQEVGGVYGALGIPVASGALLAIRILQILWFVVAAGAVGFAGYGFYLSRKFLDDLYKMEAGGRYIRYGLIVGGISLLAGIILTVLFIQMSSRAVSATPVKQSTQATTTTSAFSGMFLGASSRIVTHYPARDDKNIPRNASVLITFTDSIDVKTVATTEGKLISESVSLKRVGVGEGSVVANAELDSTKKILKITPANILGDTSKPTTYEVSVSAKLLFENGGSVLGGTGSYLWRFEVSNTIDTTPVFVEGVFPTTSSNVKVSRNGLVQIFFSEPVDPSILSGGKLEVLRKNNIVIQGDWYLANGYRTATFVPKELCGTNTCNAQIYCLPSNTDVRVVVKASTLAQPRNPDNYNKAKFPYDGVVDLAGNSLDGGGERGVKKNYKSDGKDVDNYTWSFTTSDVLNMEIPRINAITPGRNGTKVDLNAPVKVEFSSIMDATSLTTSSVVLGLDLSYWLQSHNDYQKGVTSVDILHDPLKPNSIYRPEVSSEARTIYQQCFSSCSGPMQ